MHQYTLENFKAFSEPQSIKLKPITLIYGQNSSGKSSIIQSLLMLKQTMETADNIQSILHPKGNMVDLGGFRDFIYGHETNRRFSFKIDFEEKLDSNYSTPIWYKALQCLNANNIGFKISISYNSTKSKTILDSFHIYAGTSQQPIMTFKLSDIRIRERFSRRMNVTMDPSSDLDNINVLSIDNINTNHPFWKHYYLAIRDYLDIKIKRSIISRKEKIIKRMDFNCTPDLFKSDDEKPPHLLKLEKELQDIESTLNELRNFEFADALKHITNFAQRNQLICKNFLPYRFTRYYESETRGLPSFFDYLPTMSHSEYFSFASMIIYACSKFNKEIGNMVYIGPLRDYPERHYIYSGNMSSHVGKTGKSLPDVLFKNKELLNDVNKQLSIFGIDYELRVLSVADVSPDLQDVFALLLYDKKTKINASILDVGFGISQMLPIVVQSMLSRGKILCIEQPEIHLHPRLQAEFGNLIAQSIKEPYNNNFIIETHSQHIILRLQKLIRKKILTVDDISVIYVNKTPEGAKCIELRLDSEGDFIDEWPYGFFEEGYKELFT